MKRRVFAIHYTLKGPTGEILDASEKENPLPFLEGMGQIIPALEEQIKDLTEGQKKNVKLKAADAYGNYEESLKLEVPKSELAHIPDVKTGAFLRLESNGQTQIVRIYDIKENIVYLDGNHPLAGQDLEFDIEMVIVRDATADEIAHGHVHGLEGHSAH